jgi:hypothetical protein
VSLLESALYFSSSAEITKGNLFTMLLGSSKDISIYHALVTRRLGFFCESSDPFSAAAVEGAGVSVFIKKKTSGRFSYGHLGVLFKSKAVSSTGLTNETRSIQTARTSAYWDQLI